MVLIGFNTALIPKGGQGHTLSIPSLRPLTYGSQSILGGSTSGGSSTGE